MSMVLLRWRIESMRIDMDSLTCFPCGAVWTTPLPPRPFTPAGVKGSLNSRSCFVAPNTVLRAWGCGTRVMACVGKRNGRSQGLDRWCARACDCASWRANHPSASAAKRDTTQSACKVSAASEHAVSGPRSRFPLPAPPAIGTVPSSAAVGGSGLALFERSEFSQTPHSASSAGDPQGTGSGSPFLWFVSFGEAKEMNSAAGPRPGSPRKPTPH
jgi:hypothetical protein